MNTPPSSKSLTEREKLLQIKFTLIFSIIEFIEKGLKNIRIFEGIAEIKKTLGEFSEKEVFIYSDYKTIQNGLEYFVKVGILGKEKEQKICQILDGFSTEVGLHGRKRGISSFHTAVSDIFGVYLEAFYESLMTIGIKERLMDVDKINLLNISLQNFKELVNKIEREGFPKSRFSEPINYPYDYENFSFLEPVVQILPGNEKFSLKYLPESFGLKFAEQENRPEQKEKEVKGKIADIIAIPEPTKRELFEGMSRKEKDFIISYLAVSREIGEKFDMQIVSSARENPKKLFERAIETYRGFTDEVPVADKEYFISSFLGLLFVFINEIEKKVKIINQTKDFDDDFSQRYYFFTDTLKIFNTSIIRGILLNSGSFKKHINSNGKSFEPNVIQLVETQFKKLFPSL